MNSRLLDLLICPRDHSALHPDGAGLCCAQGHRYPVVDGIPVFILAEQAQTIGVASESLRAAESGEGAPLYVETLGLSDAEKRGVAAAWAAGDNEIDPAISHLVGATSGWGYADLIGKLRSYPIPDIPVATSNGEPLLDIGCNWGRWSVSAARKGWRVVGIDPSLGALLAAQRAFANEGHDVSFVCGDARLLPFKPNAFRCAFSYSVLQHFSEADAETAIDEIGRVLAPGGVAKVQMAHNGGLRSRFTGEQNSDAGVFRVRYWPLTKLRDAFERRIGPATIAAEAYGGLGLLAEDRKLVSWKARSLIALSAALKKLAAFAPPLIRVADSVYVTAVKR